MKAVEGVPIFMDKELLLYLHDRIGRQYGRKRNTMFLAEEAYALMPEKMKDEFDERINGAPRVVIMRMREEIRFMRAAHELFAEAVEEMQRER